MNLNSYPCVKIPYMAVSFSKIKGVFIKQRASYKIIQVKI
jgi:hypothetical protein